MRFHARFFAVAADHATGSLIRDGELEDLAWVPVARAPELPMARVTGFMLRHAIHVFDAPSPPDVARPLYAHRGERTFVRYQGGEPQRRPAIASFPRARS